MPSELLSSRRVKVAARPRGSPHRNNEARHFSALHCCSLGSVTGLRQPAARNPDCYRATHLALLLAMPWGAKITDTTKMSLTGRRLFVDKVDDMLRRLQAVRCRALEYASLHSITAFAAHIPLPCASPAEHEELNDTSRGEDIFSHRGGLGHKSEEPAWSTREGLELAGKTWTSGQVYAQQEAFATEGTWGNPIDQTSRVPGTFDYLACANMDAFQTSTGDYVSLGDGGSQGRNEDAEAEETPDKQTAIKSSESHVLLAPWDRTFAGQLEQYLDYLDRTRRQSSPGPPHDALNTSSGRILEFAAHEMLGFSIPTSHLLQLQQDLEEVAKYRQTFSQSLHDVKTSLACRRSRWDTERSEGDMTFVMKSRGYGSPLAESITAVEAWPRDEWGYATARPHRKRLRGGTEAWDLEDRYSGVAPGKKRNPNSSEEVIW